MANCHATAFWIQAPGRGELVGEVLPSPGPGEVLVQARYGTVSRGTELLIYRGRVPASEFERMRAPFQAGQLPGPVKYGYVNVGTVMAGESNLLGAEVFCLYPHQDRYVVPSRSVIRLPEGVPAARAVLAANLETALNACWDARVLPGDRVVVVGGGVVGLLTGWLIAGLRGCAVQLVEPQAQRRAIGEALGLTCVAPGHAQPDADIVIHTSGTQAGLREALSLAGFEARVVELSWFGTLEPSIPLGEAFHVKRLRLVSSQVGSIAAPQRSRWDHRRRLELALSLLTDVKLDALITGICSFAALPELMVALDSGTRGGLCDLIDYSSWKSRPGMAPTGSW